MDWELYGAGFIENQETPGRTESYSAGVGADSDDLDTVEESRFDQPTGEYLQVGADAGTAPSKQATGEEAEQQQQQQQQRLEAEGKEGGSFNVATTGNSRGSSNTTTTMRESSDSWWSNDDNKKRVLIGLGVVVAIFLVIGLPIIFSSSETVEFDEVAVLIDNSGNIDRAVGPGRYFPGPAGRAIKFPRFDRTIEYTEEASSPINVRVQDGQIIMLDLSFQYHIPQANLVDIYRTHKTGFDNTLRSLARGILRDVAASYPSNSFFRNRTILEAEMRTRMETEGAERLIEITGFQIRRVVLPDQLNQRLIDVELAKQDARERQEQLVLDRINAEAAATQLRLSTARTRFITEYNQQTEVLVAEEEQRRRRVEQRTNQLVTELQEESRRNVSLYMRETDVLEEAVALQTSVELEETRRRVERVRFASETNITVYRQETENLQLGYDEQVALIEEQTRQNVTRILADTQREVEAFELSVNLDVLAAEVEAQKMLAAVREDAAELAADALGQGLLGLPSSVYLAETFSNSTMKHVRFMDESLDNLLGMALGSAGPANVMSTTNTTTP